MEEFTNKEIAGILQELASLLEIKGANKYKIRAYRNAGRKLMTINDDINDLFRKGKLEKISGIGRGIAGTIREVFNHGYSPGLEELKTELPSGVLELIKIPGLGPGRAHDLFYELGINNIDDLKEALNNGDVRELKGFGPKIEKKLLAALENYEEYRDLFFIGEAVKRLASIREYLLEAGGLIDRFSTAGSVRRMKETIANIDIVIAAENPARLNRYLTEGDPPGKIMDRGESKTVIRTEEGLPVNFRPVTPERFPGALQYFTGSREHNNKLRQRARELGYSFDKYGFKNRGGKANPAAEEEIYELLDLDYIIPELREDRGEIEAAAGGRLPESIRPDDIKGDLHVHSRFTDGAHTVEEMVEAARDRGYSYLAFTDHSRSLRVAHGMTERELVDQMAVIEGLQKQYDDFNIIKGIEVDILPDGGLDYTDGILEKLDLVIASIHTGFTQSEEEITDRIIGAIRNPHVDIIAHPQGRILGRRRSYGVDMERVIAEAAVTGTCLEINSSPYRLDLNDLMVRKAREAGVKLAINTDAHHTNELDDMLLGVGVARRGWLESGDVINTLSYDELREFFGSE